MKKQQQEPMNMLEQFCPNLACLARGKIGEGNMRIHDRQQQRYRCRSCGHTFSARRGTMLEGLREPTRDRKLADRLLHLHHELSKVTHQDFACTPAMASGLTDHIWSVEEVLTYKVAPAPWV